MTMTPEFTMLAFVLILAIVQILANVVVATLEFGLPWNLSPRDTPPSKKPSKLSGRLSRAQSNLFETLPIFIGAVILSNLTQSDGPLTTLGTQIYFFGRLIYVPIYALGLPVLRTLVWLGSLVGLCMVIYALFV